MSSNQVNTEKAYQAALLADAAYINIKDEDLNEDRSIKSERRETANKFIEARGFTKEQLESFAKRYTIKHIQLNTTTGFAGTVFIDTENDNQPIVVFRGTEPLSDLGADLVQDIFVAFGLSDTFTVGNLFQKGVVNKFLKDAELINDDEEIITNKKVKIVGHSLGGHLATLASFKYPTMVDETYTFNGAGLGLITLDTLYAEIRKYYREVTDQPTLDTKKVFNIYAEAGTSFTANGLSFTRPGPHIAAYIESQPGVFDFTNAISAGNHSMINLVNSLSVQRIIHKLNPNLSFGQINELMSFASNKEIEGRLYDGTPDKEDMSKAAESLDKIMHHLSTMLGGGFKNYTSINDTDAFYNKLVEDFGETPPFTIEPMYKLNDKVDQLITDFGEEVIGKVTRYSLMNLSPFIVIPKNADYNQGIFADDNYEWDGSFSEEMIVQRAKFMEKVLIRNVQQLANDEAVGDDDVMYVDHWFEGKTNTLGEVQGVTTLRGGKASENPLNAKQVVFGNLDSNNLSGGNKEDKLFGMDGDDNLHGRDGDDLLQGHIGNDVIDGGKGNDILQGGEGNDHYIYTTGDGHDVIEDNQGNNTLVINGKQVRTLTAINDEQSIYQDKNDNYYLMDGNDLIVCPAGGGTITIKNFQPVNFSLEIKPKEEIQPESIPNNHLLINTEDDAPNGTSLSSLLEENNNTTSMVYNAEAFKRSMNLSTDLASKWDAINWKTTNNSRLSYRETISRFKFLSFRGSTQADQLNGDDLTNYLYGHDGNDQIYGLGGHDVINGGAGSDYLVGGEGDDSIAGQSNQSQDKPDDANTIFGNGGDDQIGGGSYTDVIDGGADSDFISGYTGDDKISGGTGIDFIAGDSFSVLRAYYPERNSVVASFYGLNNKDDKYTYNDVISGGDGDDTIYGEIGDDIISGDAGADVIFGDRSINADLNVSSSALITDNFAWKAGKQPGALPVELHGDDILSGGDGEDVIVGNGGDDRLYGGSGSDRLYGDSHTENSELTGNDYLDGGAGSDMLRGGGGDDILRGGQGKDLLAGEKGNDLYLFQRNDGIDFIEDTEGQNTIRLTNIAFDDVGFETYQSPNGDFLIINHKELNIFHEKDALLINAFEKGTSTVKSGVEDMQIEFADGTRKTVLELRNQLVQSESELPTRSARRVRSVDNEVYLSSASKVDALVQAMATLATHDATDMSSSPTVNSLLRPVLTTSAV
ncbi:DUF6792 domain-containing protein [Zooshikella ganghwensis]|uniref:DUF6792 domain-containing protein n=1 Tax=Zooshikella ganghwensis TaxID=202772 RepID=UPI0003FA7CF0|nr:DUF6792 domain-containing protein [Zooshikella ganghwensis]